MSTYTADQLKGQGSPGDFAITNNYQIYTCINPDNSSYFFLESNRDKNGTYNTVGTTFGAPCASGSWTDNQVGGLVSDKYIMGCVVPPGTSSIMFIPNASLLPTRYKFRGTGTFSLETFTPRLSLFQANVIGVWFDASDLTTLFQDSAGTIPVTAAGQPVGKWLDKSPNTRHATQSISSSRPTYQIDPYGYPYLEFDGVDDFMVTSAINFSATQKITTTVGLLVDPTKVTAAIAIELGTNTNSVNGSFNIGAPSSTADHSFNLRGTSTLTARVDNIVEGDDVLTGLFDISQVTKELEITARLSGQTETGSQITWTGTNAGIGNFGNLPLYIGSRAGTSLFFKGHMYQIFVRDRISTSIENYQTEVFTNFKLNGPKDFNPSPLPPVSIPPVYYTNGYDAGNKLSYPGSGSLWTNLSGSANATLFNGVTYNSTDGSGSLRFDGINDFASIPYDATFNFSNGTYAINMWVKIGSGGTAILTCKINEMAEYDWCFAFQDNSTLIAISNDDGAVFSISPSINLNTWYLISFTSTSNVLSTYINGIKQDISQPFAPLNNFTTGYFVGLMGDSYGYYPQLSGSLSVVEYWNTPLSGSEILTYFNNTKARFGY
jgi:hypothetical protein